jgi:hypothetical protein
LLESDDVVVISRHLELRVWGKGLAKAAGAAIKTASEDEGYNLQGSATSYPFISYHQIFGFSLYIC